MLAVNILNTKHYLLLPLVLVVVVGRTGDVFGMLLSGGATGSTHTDSDGGIGVFSETSSPEAPGLPTNSARLTLTSLTSLCYAQCMAKCLDTLNGANLTIGFYDTNTTTHTEDNTTIGLYDTNIKRRLMCLPTCIRYRTTAWVKLCQNDTHCLEKCHNLRNQTETEERVPNVPQMSLQQSNPSLVQLSWPPPRVNGTVFYVVESSDDNGKTWMFITKTHNSSLVVPLDVCTRRRYRAASVSQYGSHGYQDKADVTRYDLPIPSPVRVLRVTSKVFNREEKVFHIDVQWDPPEGWKPSDVREYSLFNSMEKYCKDTLVPSIPIVDTIKPVGNENNTMVAKIRIYEMGYGCVYRTPMNAVSKCGIQGEYVNLDIDISDCNEIRRFDCPTFPSSGPGSVINASCSQLKGSRDEAVFNCTWLPPSDLGTFNKVDTYVLQWGLLAHEYTPRSSMKELGKVGVNGNVTEYELHFNTTSIGNRSAILCGLKIMPTVDEIEIGQYALAVRPVDTTFRVDDQREYGDKEKSVPATQKAITGNTNTDVTASNLQKSLYISLPLGSVMVLLVIFTVLQVARMRRARAAASQKKELFKFDDDNNSNTKYLVDNPLYTSSDPWEIPRHRLVLGEVLGKGAFGQVVMADLVQGQRSEVNGTQGQDMPTTKVAVKMLLEEADDCLTNDFEREIELMKTIGAHPNVVSMLGCCTQTEPLCLVVEYMITDLLHFLRRRRHRHLEDVPDEELLCLKDLLSFGRQISVGMEYLSQRGFVHRDLAARNVLVSDRRTVKIGDFGLTRYVYDDHVYVTRRGKRLPLKWMAIEAIQDLVFTTQTDVWSFGVVLYELITLGRAPYPTTSNRDLLRRLQLGYRMGRPDACPPSLYELMLSCWKSDPAARPSFTDLRATLEGLMEQETGVDYITICVSRDDEDITGDITSDLDVTCSDVTVDHDGVIILSDDDDEGEEVHDDVFVLDCDSCSELSSRRSSCSSRGPQTSDSSSGVSSYHRTSICLGSASPGEELLLVPSRLGLTLPRGRPSSPIPIQGQKQCHRRGREQFQEGHQAMTKCPRVVGKRQDLLRVSTCSQDRLLSSSFSEGFCSDDGQTLSHCSETQL